MKRAKNSRNAYNDIDIYSSTKKHAKHAKRSASTPNRRKGIIIALVSVITVLAVILGGGYWYLNDLLNNVNEYFSFICGLKYSNVLFEIVELNDWESIIIASIKKVIANAKDVDELKETLVILGYLKGNTSKYKIGIETTFNIVDRDFTEISNKYSNLHVKIESIIESINKRLLGISDSFENVDLLTDENSFKK